MFFKMLKTCLRRTRCLSASTLDTKILFRHTNTHKRTNTNRRPHNTLSASRKFLLSTSGQKASVLTHKIPMESSLWSWVHLWCTVKLRVITMHQRLFKHLTIPELSIASNYKIRSSWSAGKGSLTGLYVLEAGSGTGKLVEKVNYLHLSPATTVYCP